MTQEGEEEENSQQQLSGLKQMIGVGSNNIILDLWLLATVR